MDIRHRALQGIDLISATILEIGPLNRPLVPKSSGYQVYYADHCDTATLRRKYIGNPDVPTPDICDVDFNLSATSLAEAAQITGQYDVVVASHVIEHVPDLVGWLRDIAECLRPGGILALVIPDKRYTFDIFRRETETWMIDEAARDRRTRPSLRQIVEHFTNIVATDTGALWIDRSAQSEFRPSTAIEAIEALFESYRRGDYIDAHCWIVTPDSFTKLMQYAISTYSIPLEVVHFEETNTGQLEFYAQYRRTSL